MVNIVKDQKAIWKQYPDYPFIEVSIFGEVRTKDRTVTRIDGKKRFVKGHVLKQKKVGSGYMQVCVGVNGKAVYLLVHRMVATCFIPNPHNYSEVNHIDNNPTNNTVSNLEWCSHEYNVAYREKYGVSAKEASKVLRKPVFAVNLETFEVFQFESQREASRQLGVAVEHINGVIK